MRDTSHVDLAQLMSRLRSAGVQLRADDDRLVLDAPRGSMDDALLALVREHKRDLLRMLTEAGAGHARRAVSRIPPAPPAATYPLSHGQERLYFTQLLYPDSVTYQLPDVLRLDGPVDPAHIERVLNELVRRHEGFRTGFDLDGDEPVATVHEDVTLRLEHVHDPDFAPEGPGGTGDFVHPFDLEHPPLLRARLVTVRPDLHYLLTDKHHLVFDAASRPLFARDFVRAHRGEPLGPLPVGYKDFAVWQRRLDGPELRRMGEYWDSVFASEPRVDLAPAQLHPELFGSESRRAHVEFDAGRTAALRAFCQFRGLTTAMFLQAVYHLAVHRFTGQGEVVIGFPVDVRADAGLDDQLGLFVNTVPVRSFPEPTLTFTEFAASVRDGILAGLDHSQYPYDAIVERACSRRNVSEDPLVDGFFNMVSADPQARSPWADADLAEVVGDPRAALPELPCLTCRLDLTLSVLEAPDSLRLELDCTTALLEQRTVERIAADLAFVVDAVVEAPDTPLGALAGAVEEAT
ncbi:condensation domain-containing protein [Streptomyces sp. NBC_01092]|uniref:condensation domain-containing protein n=1 Tax=Streptomyces sp. NBC_01092 TaxID=2903748 RepID=UPI003866BCC8|nr:condensation domain-containing protein [Streptomyces sp. NBC_01092]